MQHCRKSIGHFKYFNGNSLLKNVLQNFKNKYGDTVFQKNGWSWKSQRAEIKEVWVLFYSPTLVPSFSVSLIAPLNVYLFTTVQ